MCNPRRCHIVKYAVYKFYSLIFRDRAVILYRIPVIRLRIVCCFLSYYIGFDIFPVFFVFPVHVIFHMLHKPSPAFHQRILPETTSLFYRIEIYVSTTKAPERSFSQVLPLIPMKLSVYLQNYIQRINHPSSPIPLWLCPRPISNSQLHALPHFHLCPIYLVVFKGSY